MGDGFPVDESAQIFLLSHQVVNPVADFKAVTQSGVNRGLAFVHQEGALARFRLDVEISSGSEVAGGWGLFGVHCVNGLLFCFGASLPASLPRKSPGSAGGGSQRLVLRMPAAFMALCQYFATLAGLEREKWIDSDSQAPVRKSCSA